MKLPAPRATFVLGAATAAAWLLTSAAGLADCATYLAGFIPARAAGSLTLSDAVPVILTPLTATLVHAGLIHLGFNLLMLGFCGRFVEMALGGRGMIAIYVAAAYAAATAQFAIGPTAVGPMVGASGAVSGLVGAYAVLFGRRQGRALGPLSGEFVYVIWLAAAWIGLQLLLGFAAAGEGASIATAAHVGGFVSGLVLARPLLRFRYRDA